MLTWLLNLDGGILLFIQQQIRMPVFDPLIIFITRLGNAGLLWIAVSLLLLIFPKTRKVGILSFLSLFFSLLVNNLLLKNLIARTRPYDVVEGLVPLIERQRDTSFPSGHTGSSFASACVLHRELKGKAGALALVMAVLISLSRLYVGVHYPSDVLAGMVTGIGCSYLAEWCKDRFCNSEGI